MTLDELTVKITVAAEEAMGILDELAAREKALSGAFGGKYRVEIDGGKALLAMGEISRMAEKTGRQLDNVDFGRSFTEARENMDRLAPDFSAWLRGKYEGMLAALEEEGVYISSGMREVFWHVLENAFSLGEFVSFEELERMVSSTLGRLSDAMRDPRIGEAVETLRGYWGVFSEESLTDAQRGDMSSAWRRLFDDDGKLVELLSDIPGITENAAQSLIALGLNMEAAGEETAGLTEELLEGMQGMEEASGQFEDTAQSAKEFGEGLSEQKETLREVLSQMLELGKKDAAVSGLQEMRKKLDECERGSADYEKALAALREEMSLAGIEAEAAGGDMESMDESIGAAAKTVASAAGVMAQRLSAVVDWAARAKNSVNISGSVSVNTGSAISALNSVIAKAGQAFALLKSLGMAMAGGVSAGIAGISGGGSGGGSGGKTAREQGIEDYYVLIEHKKRLDQLTLEEELKMLNTLRSKYSLTAKERMEWDEKVYAVKKAIRERDAEEIDRLSEGVVQALERRYEAMQEKELAQLDESREAWKKWRDDSVKAVEKQLEALEKLEEVEKREKRDAAELRKIEKLRQAMEYEQDLFNREMLRLQLEEAIAAREERLRKEQIAGQKTALEEEIEKISRSAEEQLKALDEEEEQLRAYYEERMKAAALQAEAEKMVLSAKQNELMNLLSAYAPEYEALGQNMGERLLNGFIKKVGSITTWFGQFSQGLSGMQKTMANASVAAAERFYAEREAAQNEDRGVVVNQNVTFNEPVESPAQVARRMADVNDALGQLLG